MFVDQQVSLFSLPALLLVAASGFGVMILLVVILCVFLSVVLCRTRRYQRKGLSSPLRTSDTFLLLNTW